MRLMLLGVALIWAIILVTDAAPADETCSDEDMCEADLRLHFCKAGTNSPFQCHNCSVGYIPNSAGSGCVQCSSKCDICELKASDNTQTDCITCSSGYYLDTSTKTCIDSQISKCVVANITSASVAECVTCEDGYYLSTSNTVCDKCGSGCKTCSSSACNMCTSSSNVISGLDATKCTGCSSHCTTCITGDSTVATKCTKCDSNYYVDSSDECASCSDNKCDICDTSASTCDTCKTSYYNVLSGSCTSCGFKCDACTDDTLCGTCKDEYTPKAAIEVSCDVCPANCNVCDVEDARDGKCGTCDLANGYTKDTTTKKCVACNSIPNCAECTSTSGTVTCSACESGYIDDNNACFKCPANCDSGTGDCVYNSTLTTAAYCTNCVSEFALNAADGCTACDNCGYCTYNSTHSATVCECLSGIVDITDPTTDHYRGDCDSGDLYACKPGFYYDESSSYPKCTACEADGCAHCNMSAECLTCSTADGYAAAPASDGSCHKCGDASKCTACSLAETYFKCDKCSAGYFTSNTTCTGCAGNCNECSTTTACTNCMDNFVKFGTNTCVACNSPCSACTTTTEGTAECTACVSKYVFDSTASTADKCKACPDNCATCELDTSNNVVCTSNGCDDYFGISDGVCTACPDKCTECTKDSTGSFMVCDTCKSKYTKNDKVCTPCPLNCKTCSFASGIVTCSVCKDEYYVDSDGQCSKCLTDCLECDATKCSKCKPGKGLSKTKDACLSCALSTMTGIANCNNCTDTNVDGNSTCLGCSSSYTIADNSTKCIGVITGQCTSSSDMPSKCTHCQDNSLLIGNNCFVNCSSCGSDIFNPSGDSTCNDGSGVHTTIQCQFGCAWTSKTIDESTTFAKGCANETMAALDDSCQGDGDRFCVCGTDNCNVGGMPSSARYVSISIVLMVTALLSLVA